MRLQPGCSPTSEVNTRGSQQWHPEFHCFLSPCCWWEGIMSWQGFFTALERLSSASELAQRVIQLQGCSICMQASGAADGWLLLLNCASFPEELRLSKCNNLSFLSQDCSQTTVKRGKLLIKHYPFILATGFRSFVNFVWHSQREV